jgi:hypothetical protein
MKTDVRYAPSKQSGVEQFISSLITQLSAKRLRTTDEEARQSKPDPLSPAHMGR